VSTAPAASLGRLVRYGLSGGASALTHALVLVALVEAAHVWPVAASVAGFVASILVSYALQRSWVFASATRHAVTGPRFVTVTGVAFLLNAGIMWVGTGLQGVGYPVAQAVAFVAVPISNYTLNSRWTFRA
jgi:putative flippase GtrA